MQETRSRVQENTEFTDSRNYNIYLTKKNVNLFADYSYFDKKTILLFRKILEFWSLKLVK